MSGAADLFAGLGGLTCGAEQAGVAVKLAANHNPDAVEWHERNHPDVIHACQDLAEFDWTQLGAHGADGLLLAAPACQGFSECGQPAAAGTGGSHKPNRTSINTKQQRDRNTTWAVLAAADTARPQTIVVENVPRLQRWSTFPAWVACLESMGYHVSTQVLNARDFGLAQDRPRLIVVADQRRRVELVTRPNPMRALSQLGDVLLPDDHPDHRWRAVDSKSGRMQLRIRRSREKAGSRFVWNNVSESLGRPMEGVAPTLTTKAGSQLNLVDGDRMRTLHPRELARIQGFPDSYEIPANRRLASLLIGNATPVAMARSIVEQVAA